MPSLHAIASSVARSHAPSMTRVELPRKAPWVLRQIAAAAPPLLVRTAASTWIFAYPGGGALALGQAEVTGAGPRSCVGFY